MPPKKTTKKAPKAKQSTAPKSAPKPERNAAESNHGSVMTLLIIIILLIIGVAMFVSQNTKTRELKKGISHLENKFEEKLATIDNELEAKKEEEKKKAEEAAKKNLGDVYTSALFDYSISFQDTYEVFSVRTRLDEGLDELVELRIKGEEFVVPDGVDAVGLGTDAGPAVVMMSVYKNKEGLDLDAWLANYQETTLGETDLEVKTKNINGNKVHMFMYDQLGEVDTYVTMLGNSHMLVISTWGNEQMRKDVIKMIETLEIG